MPTVLDFQIRPGKDNRFPVEVFERDRETSKVPGKENTSKISLTQRRRERGEEKRNNTLRIYASPRLRVSASPRGKKKVAWIYEIRL